MNKVLIISGAIVLILSIAGFREAALFEGLVSETVILLLLGFSLITLAVIGRRKFHKKK